MLAAIFGGSQFLGDLLVANPDWLAVLDLDGLQHPRRSQGFQREVAGGLETKFAARDYAGAFAELRRFKQRELLRIGARDLARIGDVVEITQEISDWRMSASTPRCGFAGGNSPRDPAGRITRAKCGRWHPTGFCVLGLGKLGGQELNYSSDVDLFLSMTTKAKCSRSRRRMEPRRVPSCRATSFSASWRKLFCRRSFARTADGFLFRVDLRLRPEGDAGPLARSLDSCENYYAQWGQTWERMMLIKARPSRATRRWRRNFWK